MSAPQSCYRDRMTYLYAVNLFGHLFLRSFIFFLKVIKIERIITKVYVCTQQNFRDFADLRHIFMLNYNVKRLKKFEEA